MKHIISASRRSDIPRFYPDWFCERRKAGYVEFRNAFGVKGSASLSAEHVLGYLFWTRYAKPFAAVLRMLREEGVPHVFQYTINAYGKALDKHVPQVEQAVTNFLAVSENLPSPACIQWRYDPILLSDRYGMDFHFQSFQRIAAALAGATQVVNTSFTEPYLKTVRRVGDRSARYRKLDSKRHRTVAARFPKLGQIVSEGKILLEGLSCTAAEHGIELRVCSNPEWSMPRAKCCGVELFEPYGADVIKQVSRLKSAPSRIGCRCLKVIDIGMDNTCLGGCRYCYVVHSHQSAVENFRRHDPHGNMLRISAK